jgi:hypothetical protein
LEVTNRLGKSITDRPRWQSKLTQLTLIACSLLVLLAKTAEALEDPKSDVPNSVAFVKEDRVTRGNWAKSYGRDGYYMAFKKEPGSDDPNVKITGNTDITWAENTADPRALNLQPSSPDRFAAAWQSSSEVTDPKSVTIDVRVSGNEPRQVALYLLDWNSGNRAQLVEAMDGDKNNVLLDSWLASSYGNGVYLVWNVKGHIRFRITSTTTATAVVSGIFFGDAVKAGAKPPKLELAASVVPAIDRRNRRPVPAFKVDLTPLFAHDTTVHFSDTRKYLQPQSYKVEGFHRSEFNNILLDKGAKIEQLRVKDYSNVKPEDLKAAEEKCKYSLTFDLLETDPVDKGVVYLFFQRTTSVKGVVVSQPPPDAQDELTLTILNAEFRKSAGGDPVMPEQSANIFASKMVTFLSWAQQYLTDDHAKLGLADAKNEIITSGKATTTPAAPAPVYGPPILSPAKKPDDDRRTFKRVTIDLDRTPLGPVFQHGRGSTTFIEGHAIISEYAQDSQSKIEVALGQEFGMSIFHRPTFREQNPEFSQLSKNTDAKKLRPDWRSAVYPDEGLRAFSEIRIVTPQRVFESGSFLFTPIGLAAGFAPFTLRRFPGKLTLQFAPQEEYSFDNRKQFGMPRLFGQASYSVPFPITVPLKGTQPNAIWFEARYKHWYFLENRDTVAGRNLGLPNNESRYELALQLPTSLHLLGKDVKQYVEFKYFLGFNDARGFYTDPSRDHGWSIGIISK